MNTIKSLSIPLYFLFCSTISWAVILQAGSDVSNLVDLVSVEDEATKKYANLLYETTGVIKNRPIWEQVGEEWKIVGTEDLSIRKGMSSDYMGFTPPDFTKE